MSLNTAITVTKVSGFTTMLFDLLFFGFVLVLMICWVWNLVSFGIAKAYKRHEIARQAGKLLLYLSGIAAATIVLIWWALFPSPTRIYRGAFGENPTSDVTDLLGKQDSNYDSQVVNLRFQAAPSTIRRLVNLNALHWVPRSQSSAPRIDNNDAPPQWWQPKVTARTSNYRASKRDGAFASEDFYLDYDQQTQTAYYSYFGVD